MKRAELYTYTWYLTDMRCPGRCLRRKSLVGFKPHLESAVCAIEKCEESPWINWANFKQLLNYLTRIGTKKCLGKRKKRRIENSIIREVCYLMITSARITGSDICKDTFWPTMVNGVLNACPFMPTRPSAVILTEIQQTVIIKGGRNLQTSAKLLHWRMNLTNFLADK